MVSRDEHGVPGLAGKEAQHVLDGLGALSAGDDEVPGKEEEIEVRLEGDGLEEPDRVWVEFRM
jgi:hypothetical protein